ncbi:MAG: FAD-dependent oxidoreductase [Brumimicrobium sp.]
MKVFIVGGGLAGICIAHQLYEHEIPFKIIDRGVNYSTLVAGGMINPITFRRLVKTWRCDDFITHLTTFYPKIENRINQRFFYPIKLRRTHSSKDEVDMWNNRLDDKGFKQYISAPNSEKDTPSYLANEYGNAFVNTPGYIDSKSLMEGNHRFFKEKSLFIQEEFDFQALDVENKRYKDEDFTHFIFAEGFQGEDNPFFNYLPFKNAKGEILTVVSDELKKDEIINRKCYVLPTKHDDFLLGSTYVWGTKDPSPTEEGKQDLLKLYQDLSTAKVEVINHEAGIRPTSADRRPMIGEHPEHKGLYIFNGLGAKGFTYAPYFAEEFVDFILGKKEIDHEVNIQRFYAKYYMKS